MLTEPSPARNGFRTEYLESPNGKSLLKENPIKDNRVLVIETD